MRLARETKLYAATLQDLMDLGGLQATVGYLISQNGVEWTYTSAIANDTNETLEITISKLYVEEEEEQPDEIT